MTIADTIRLRFHLGTAEDRAEQRLLYHEYVRARDGDDTAENLGVMVMCNARSEFIARGRTRKA